MIWTTKFLSEEYLLGMVLGKNSERVEQWQ
jgi:hypothetical protein